MENDTKKDWPKDAAYKITIDGTQLSCYLKKLPRVTLEAVLGMVAGKSNPQYIRAGEIILNACWISGDEEIKTNEDNFVAACFSAYEVIDIKTATLEKR
jgi:hypothetical protein